jgi:hypothetical protein
VACADVWIEPAVFRSRDERRCQLDEQARKGRGAPNGNDPLTSCSRDERSATPSRGLLQGQVGYQIAPQG